MQATVTQIDPLVVLVDGAQTACPAELGQRLGLAVGGRVKLEDRAPRLPLVTGHIRA